MGVFLVYIAGCVLFALLCAHLQGRLENRLAVAYDTAPIARRRRFWWNAAVAATLHGTLFALAGVIGTELTASVILALYAANIGLHRLFGRVLSPGDLNSAREALTFLPSYVPSGRLVVIAAALALTAAGALLLGYWANAALAFTSGSRFRLGLLPASMAGWAVLWSRARAWPLVDDALAYSQTDQNVNVRRLGFLLQGWLLLVRMSRLRKPHEFDRRIDVLSKARRVGGQPEVCRDAAGDPDVIVLMMESLADLAELGIPLAAEPLAYVKAERPERARGRLNVPVVGGNTCNTEFEVLTGIPTGSDGSGMLPYMSRLNDGVYGLPHCLKRRGYTSCAVHPFHRWFYNRDRVYRKLGFDEFFADESFHGAARQFDRISDKAFVDLILSKLEADRPNFVFGVSIMGHGPYRPAEHDGIDFVDPSFFKGQPLQKVVDQYCRVTAATDHALAHLHRGLESRARPYVLVVFGDHVPFFTNSLNGLEVWRDILTTLGNDQVQEDDLFRTPLFVFSNIPGVVNPPFGTLDASDLGAEILARLGIADEAAFGALRACRMAPEDRAVYAYDTIYGAQLLTRDLVATTEGERYELNSRLYGRYNTSSRQIDTLFLLMKEGRYEEFDALYATLPKDDVLIGRARLLWAARQIDLGRTDNEVVQALADVIASPDPFWGYYHSARLNLTQGDYAAVSADVAAAYATGSGESLHLVVLGRGRFTLKDFPGALAVLDPLVNAGERNPDANLLWAAMQIDVGRTDAAIDAALNCAAAAPQPFWAYYHHLRLLLARQDHARVRDIAAAAARLLRDRQQPDGELVSALMGLVRPVFIAGNREAALALLEPLVEAGVSSPEADLLWAAARIDVGRIDDGVKAALDRAVAMGDRFWALYHRIRLHVARGSLADAVADADAAEEINPAGAPNVRALLP